MQGKETDARNNRNEREHMRANSKNEKREISKKEKYLITSWMGMIAEECSTILIAVNERLLRCARRKILNDQWIPLKDVRAKIF